MEQAKIAKTCPTCNAELIQRSRLTLFLAGVVFAAVAIVLVWLSQWLWLPAALLVVIALYLAIWSWRANGLWCRDCKREVKPATSGQPASRCCCG